MRSVHIVFIACIKFNTHTHACMHACIYIITCALYLAITKCTIKTQTAILFALVKLSVERKCTWRISYRALAMTFPPLPPNFGSLRSALRISFGGICGSSWVCFASFAGEMSSVSREDEKCFSFATSLNGGSSAALPPKKYKSRKTPKQIAIATNLQ